MLIFLLFAISLSFQKVIRVNNKVHYIQSYILIASYTHTDHTKRDDNKNVDNNHHQIAAVLRFFARIIRCFFYVSFMSRNLFLIIFRNHPRAVTFPREALFFSILTNSFNETPFGGGRFEFERARDDSDDSGVLFCEI